MGEIDPILMGKQESTALQKSALMPPANGREPIKSLIGTT